MILTNLIDLRLGDAGFYALLGYGVVFLGLILLMFLVTILGKIFIFADRKTSAKAAPALQPEVVPQPEAPGTAGQLSLNNVDPKTAAILMAIVADKLQKPINELRFISVKEVTK